MSILLRVTPHTRVIPVKTGIQTLLLFPKRIWIPAPDQVEGILSRE